MSAGAQFPYSEMPLSDERRLSLLKKISSLSVDGMSVADVVKFNEMWCLRVGVDDEWLLNLAYRLGALRGESQ